MGHCWGDGDALGGLRYAGKVGIGRCGNEGPGMEVSRDALRGVGRNVSRNVGGALVMRQVNVGWGLVLVCRKGGYWAMR